MLERYTRRDHLALDRTHLANERTLLAYIRTSLALLLSGGVIIKFFIASSYLAMLGILLIASGFATAVLGFQRFIHYKKEIKKK